MKATEISDKERWNQKYAGEDYAHGTEPVEFLKESGSMLVNGEGKRALVLAMGEGRNAVYIATLGYDVVGIDVSVKGALKAKRMARERGVKLGIVVADLKDFPLPEESFDLVACFYYLERTIFGGIERCLKPSGIIIYETFTEDQKNFNHPWNEAYLLKRGELPGYFSNFEIVHSWEGVIESETGKRAVSRLIARKPSLFFIDT